MLVRKVPLKRTCASYEAFKKRKPLRKVSKSRGKDLRIYSKLKLEWHKQHPYCEALCNDQNILTPSEPYPHHIRGRHKDRLNQTEYWLAICCSCHRYIEENRLESMSRGWLQSRHLG